MEKSFFLLLVYIIVMSCVELKQTGALPNNCIPYNCTQDNGDVKTTINCTSLFNRTLNGEIDENWEIYYDDEAESYYYYNPKTKESTWTPPLKNKNKTTSLEPLAIGGKRRKTNKRNNKKKRKWTKRTKRSRH